jgi:hypothetical protein
MYLFRAVDAHGQKCWIINPGRNSHVCSEPR